MLDLVFLSSKFTAIHSNIIGNIMMRRRSDTAGKYPFTMAAKRPPSKCIIHAIPGNRAGCVFV